MNDVDRVRRSEQAKTIIENPIYIESWEIYRSRIMTLIESADSNATEKVMHLKRLLNAVSAARKHFEAVMKDGSVAAEEIRIENERKKWWK